MRTLLLLLALVTAASAETVVSGAIQPQLAQDTDGGFYCVFIRNGNIELTVSADGGKTWSAPVVAIDAGGKASGGRQRGPRIGVDAKKNVFVTAPVCFDPVKQKEKYPPAELWIAVSNDAGKTFGKPSRVNDVDGAAAESLHQIAVAPSGEAHVVWLDNREGKGNCVWYARISGGKASKNVRLTPPCCPCCAPGIGLDGKGNPFVVYREMTDDGSREIFMTVSRDGGKSFSPTARVNRKDTRIPDCPMDAPTLAVSDDGKKFAVGWMGNPEGKDKDVFWAVSENGGVLPLEKRISDDAKGVQAHPTAGTDAAGVFHIAWEDARAGKTAIWATTSAPGATNERLSAEGVEAAFPSLSAGKSVGIVWEQGGGVEFRKIK
ncbi:MAG: glycoside hydrolase [Planctomycetes bacterium]|nr:glycoside hydrolase [Planctomycetota bacterium]